MTVVGTGQLAALRPVPPVVVVIDVLRAFTTAAVALAGLADGVVLAATADQALQIQDRLPGSLAVKDGPPVRSSTASTHRRGWRSWTWPGRRWCWRLPTAPWAP